MLNVRFATPTSPNTQHEHLLPIRQFSPNMVSGVCTAHRARREVWRPPEAQNTSTFYLIWKFFKKSARFVSFHHSLNSELEECVQNAKISTF
jgi:hypothetical protein